MNQHTEVEQNRHHAAVTPALAGGTSQIPETKDDSMTEHFATPSLTVILPVRCAAERMDAIARLSFPLHDTHRPASLEILVVDDGSPIRLSEQLRKECETLGYRYHRIASESETFSIGRARNVGTQLARHRHVMFQDIDLMPYPGFYQDVLNEIEVQGLSEYSERFLMFGVIYLTQDATSEYMETPAALRRSRFTQYLLEDDKTRIEKFSTGTSVTVWNRAYFLATGGNDPDFAGWGYEDIEYNCRAIRRANRFPLPAEFGLDYRNFQSIAEYRGWKSIYRLFGDTTFQKGMVLFHAWHPVEQKSAYAKAKERNRKLFESKMVAFKERGEEPPPLAMPERGRSVIFRTNPWVYNRWITPMLGELVLLDEDMFSGDSFVEYLTTERIDRVVFHNPYANPRMHELYQAVKSHQIPFLVCERGALPNSVFFDDKGFNGESASYAPERWKRPLSAAEQDAVHAYVRDYKASEEHLEEQSEHLGGAALRRKLRIFQGTKILFVPLQRPTDTVITHLAGPIESYDNFLALVRRLVHTLPAHWTIVVKRHPLEVQSPDLPGVIYADDCNINDLIEASDAVLLINSGVGLISLMHEKLVLHAGTAFYGHAGLAHQVVDHDDVLHTLRHARPDREAILQFLHYLVFEFYSFANFKTRRVAWTDGSLMTATTAIDYRVARIPGCDVVRMEHRTTVAVADKSILFDRYRGIDGNIRRQTGAAQVPAAVTKAGPAAKPAPAPAKKPAPVAKPAQASPSVPAVRPELTLVKSEVQDAVINAPGNQNPRIMKKLKKLRENPVMFMRDSKHPMLRAIGWSLQHD